MLTVNCNLCAANGKIMPLSSNIIAKSKKEELQLTAMEMAKHLELSHGDMIKEIVRNSMDHQALLAMLCFDSDDDDYNAYLEETRERVIDMIIPDVEDDEEDEEELDEEGELDDDEEDEDGEVSSKTITA